MLSSVISLSLLAFDSRLPTVLTVVLPHFPHLWPCGNPFLLSFGFMFSIQTRLSPHSLDGFLLPHVPCSDCSRCITTCLACCLVLPHYLFRYSIAPVAPGALPPYSFGRHCNLCHAFCLILFPVTTLLFYVFGMAVALNFPLQDARVFPLRRIKATLSQKAGQNGLRSLSKKHLRKRGSQKILLLTRERKCLHSVSIGRHRPLRLYLSRCIIPYLASSKTTVKLTCRRRRIMTSR